VSEPRRTAEHEALRFRSGLQAFRNPLAAVDHGHRNARHRQVAGREPAAVVVGEDRDAVAGLHGEAIDIGADRRRRHHARPVVPGEDDAALERARGKHRAIGHDPPQSLARLVRLRHRQMIGYALERAERAAVVEPE
jgi:hypothetical protein